MWWIYGKDAKCKEPLRSADADRWETISTMLSKTSSATDFNKDFLLSLSDWYFFTSVIVCQNDICTCKLFQHYGYCGAVSQKKTPVSKTGSLDVFVRKVNKMGVYARALSNKPRAVSVSSEDPDVNASYKRLELKIGEWLTDAQTRKSG